MKKVLLVLLIVLALGALIYFVTAVNRPKGDANTPAASQNGWKAYTNTEYGVSFSYPPAYSLDEMRLGASGPARLAVVLARSEDLPPPQDGEGPPAMTFIFYPNPDKMGAEEWIRTTPESNFALSPYGVIDAAFVGSRNALGYQWSGLYEGDTVAIADSRYVYTFSVTYIAPEDQIRKDFREVLKTVKFLDFEPLL